MVSEWEGMVLIQGGKPVNRQSEPMLDEEDRA